MFLVLRVISCNIGEWISAVMSVERNFKAVNYKYGISKQVLIIISFRKKKIY